MNAHARVVAVSPGRGVVVRWDGGVAVVGGSENDAGDVLASLDESLGSDFTVDEVVALLGGSPFNGADIAMILEKDEGFHALVRGACQVRNEGNQVLAGPQFRHQFLGDPGSLWIGLNDRQQSPVHSALNLRSGVVPGGGALVYRHAGLDGPDAGLGLEPSMTKPRPPLRPDRGSVRPFESIELDGIQRLPGREPLPIAVEGEGPAPASQLSDGVEVLGINCSRGHFNNPIAGYCQLCGISMVHLTHRLVPGSRPTLGFVVFGDGASYALDRSYVVGRGPRPAQSGDRTPLVVDDPFHSLSREHALIELRDWDVFFTDLGSKNGSFLWQEDPGQWQPIPPGSSQILRSGAAVAVGRSWFTFEQAARQIEG